MQVKKSTCRVNLVQLKNRFSFYLFPELFGFMKSASNQHRVFASIAEPEGETYIIYCNENTPAKEIYFPWRCIQLQTPTRLEEVGITARVAKSLAEKKIPCNVVAAFHHDYFFVPEHRAEEALHILNTVF